jgi:hypothetical protein
MRASGLLKPSDFIAKMSLQRATPADNDRLIQYYSQAFVPGTIELKQERMFNFFSQYAIQSEEFSTYILQNDQQKIEAIATLVFREGLLEGRREKIGFATDLRVSPNRRAILGWSQHFLPALEKERNQHDARYVFSIVPHSQRQAYNAFIRPRHLRREFPRYHLFRRFQVVSLHGLWPFHDLPLSGIKIRSANNNDREQLAEYILRQTAGRPLAPYGTVEGFYAGLARWRDLGLENFILAFDRYNNLIGCVAPWSPDRVQRTYPIQYDSKAENFRDLMSLLSLFKLAHPLPQIGSQFELRHLTHLYADNPDIFYSLLYNAFQMAGKKEFLLYPHFDGDLLTLPPRSFFSAETPYGMYCVLNPTDPVPDFIKPRSMQLSPVLEPAFL